MIKLTDRVQTFAKAAGLICKLEVRHSGSHLREWTDEQVASCVLAERNRLWKLFNSESKHVLGSRDQQWASGLQRAMTLIESGI